MYVISIQKYGLGYACSFHLEESVNLKRCATSSLPFPSVSLFLRDLFGEELQNGALSDSKEATEERYIRWSCPD